MNIEHHHQKEYGDNTCLIIMIHNSFCVYVRSKTVANYEKGIYICMWRNDEKKIYKQIRTRNIRFWQNSCSKYVNSKTFGQTMGSNQIYYTTPISLDFLYSFQFLESNYIYIYLSMVIQCVPRKGFGSAVWAKNDI